MRACQLQGIQKRGDGHFIFSACSESKIIDRKSIGNKNRPRDWQKREKKEERCNSKLSYEVWRGSNHRPQKVSLRAASAQQLRHAVTSGLPSASSLCHVQSAGAVHEPVFLIRPPKKAGSLRRHGRHDVRTWYERRCHALLGRTRTGHQTWRAEVAFGTRRVHGM